MTTDERIEKLDLTLFDSVPSQTTEEDKRTLLAAQTAVRRNFPGYIYLEIGSHKGGSLQPHVVDPKCGRIISIDPRPAATPDSRGTFNYERVTTESMLGYLQKIAGADISKIKTYETTAAGLTEKMLGGRPQLCFIDGEHTDEAALADARFCLSVLAENGVILFHDANLVFTGLEVFLNELSASGRAFAPHILPRSVFLIEVGGMRFCDTEPLRERVRQNYKAYLGGLADNDWYRRSYHLPIYQGLRKVVPRRFWWVNPDAVPIKSPRP